MDTKVVRSGGFSEEEGMWPRSKVRRPRWLVAPWPLGPQEAAARTCRQQIPLENSRGTSPRRHPQQRLPIFKVKV